MRKSLAGRHVFVAGASTLIGIGIVRQLLHSGATVVAPAKRAVDITRLKDAVEGISTGRLVTMLADMPDYRKAVELADAIVEEFGHPELAVVALDSPDPSEELTSLPALHWHKMLDENLTSFFMCGRIILDLMKQNRHGTYISISNTDHLEIQDRSTLSGLYTGMEIEMAKTFARETAGYNIRYYHLLVNNVNQCPESMKQPCSIIPDRVNPDQIGEYILQQYARDSRELFHWCLGKKVKNEKDVRELVLRKFDSGYHGL